MRIDLRKSALFIAFGLGLMVSAPGQASADTVCDLRVNGGQSANCSITGINTGLFYTDEQHPTGTGFIDSFVRIQQNGWEQGYNTSARPVEPNNNVKTDPNYTRDLKLSEVGTKVIDGVTYREFFLDINEPAATNGSKNYITLDQLEVYVSNKPSLDNYCASGANNSSGLLGDGSPSCGSDAVKIYDMDAGAGGDGYVQLDYLVKGNGSGSSDMTFYLESSKFGNYEYVYLFSQFGDFANKSYKYESQAGFEEWFVKSAVPPPSINAVPEPASLLLLGSGLAAAAIRRRRRTE